MLTEPGKITDKTTRYSHLELFYNTIDNIVSESLRHLLLNFTFNILVELEISMTLRMDFDFQLEKTLNCFLSLGAIDFCH